MRRLILTLLVLSAATSTGVLCQRGKTVTFVPHWAPQAQFAGFYVAKDRGIYRQHGIDVTSAMWYNEYHTILSAGFNPDELNTIFFADCGLNFPEDGIYCSGEFLASHPETCREFVLATLEGWQYAVEHPEETLAIVSAQMEEAALPTNTAHQRWMLARMKDPIFPGTASDSFGELSPDSYRLVAETLREEDLITTIPAYAELYRPVLRRTDR